MRAAVIYRTSTADTYPLAVPRQRTGYSNGVGMRKGLPQTMLWVCKSLRC